MVRLDSLPGCSALPRAMSLVRFDPRWAPYLDACVGSKRERNAIAWLGRGLVPLAARSERLAFLAVRGVADRPLDGAASMALAAVRLTRDFLWR